MAGISIRAFVIVYFILILGFYCAGALCIACDTTFIVLLLHIVANIRALRHRIETIDLIKSESEVIDRIKSFVSEHNRVHDLIERIQEVTSVSILLLYCTIGCTMCLIAIDVSMNHSNSNLIKESCLMIAIFFQLLSSTVPGTVLQNEVVISNLSEDPLIAEFSFRGKTWPDLFTTRTGTKDRQS